MCSMPNILVLSLRSLTVVVKVAPRRLKIQNAGKAQLGVVLAALPAPFGRGGTRHEIKRALGV
jgi:hypothetical protein